MENWNTCYPRPQMRRSSFFSLNGEWTVGSSTVTVPFPLESQLAGFEGSYTEEPLYQREFELPPGFVPENGHVLLHFGAVDQLAYVFVNDRPAVTHDGGYLPFSAGITRLLFPGKNVISVACVDNLSMDYPYGKQRKKPGGMWYTPVTGIWQSVWLEAVPEKYIHSVKIVPSLAGIKLTVQCDEPEFTVETAGIKISGKSQAEMEILLPQPHLWTCEDPFLYDAVITCGKDTVRTYFGLRTVEVDGNKILLNGKPVFLAGVLDQGYFPGGHYLPETPEGYDQDILRMKTMGFNLLRKHAKVEPDIFYAACDKLGILVLQDIVHSGYVSYFFDTALPNLGLKKRPDKRPGGKHRKEIFEKIAIETLDFLRNHPCVIGYTIFNEGWGQFDSDRIYTLLRQKDSTRIYDSTSGWFAQKKSDVDSEHVYFKPRHLKPGARPMLLSECGGFAYPVPGHSAAKKAYGYGAVSSQNELTDKIQNMLESMVIPAIKDGLCGYILTQLSDVENEVNGLYTFDRQVCKADPDRIEALNEKMKHMVQ